MITLAGKVITIGKWITHVELVKVLSEYGINIKYFIEAVRDGKLTAYDENGLEIVHAPFSMHLSNAPHGYKYSNLNTPKVLEYHYKGGDINKFIGNISSASDSDNTQIESAEDYIQDQRNAGEKDPVIAYKLHDKNGNFKLAYAQIARFLGKDEGLNKNQHDALKQRGRRLCEKGKDILRNH